MIRYIRGKSRTFYSELLSNWLFTAMLVAYILLKAVSNIVHGASYFTAFRSGIMGVIMYLVGFYAIHLAAKDPGDIEKTDSMGGMDSNSLGGVDNKAARDEKKDSLRIEPKAAKSGLCLSGAYFIFLLITVIDNLQRKGVLAGNPVLSYLPGYDRLLSVIWKLSQFVSGAADFILPEQIRNIIIGNLLYVLIPLLLFKLLGFRFSSLFSLKNTRASWPIVVIYLIMFAVNGITAKRIWGFAYSLLYPALCEEFFHRGIIYRSAGSMIKSVPVALAVGTIAFGLMHFPDYFFRVYEGSLLLTFSNIADVFLFGLLMAFGYRKTGTLLPWILVHALSDSLYL